MAAFYILFSKSADKFYIGATSNLENRIDLHLQKEFKNSFTAKYNDWELFFSIEEIDLKLAYSIEAHVKKMKSKKYILNLRKYPEMAENLLSKLKSDN